jgi:hypothetical protein
MGPVLVVMGHEHIKNARKVLVVQNQHPVETFRASRAHKPLRYTVGLRRAKRRANDLDPVASKHLVKSVCKFPVPITNQETDAFWALRQSPRHMPGLLRDPQRVRRRSASGQMHTAAAQFDEEQHLEPLQPDCLDCEKVDGQHALPVRPDELAPGHPSASASRSKPSCPKPCPHRRS